MRKVGADLRWFKQRPDGPGAESGGKDKTALEIIPKEKETGRE